MITKFSMLKRRPDLNQAQYSEYWRNTHADVLIKKGGHHNYNKRYVQNHFLHDVELPDLSREYDGAAQMTPQSEKMVTQGFQKDPLYMLYVRPDEDMFLDVPKCVVLYCDSYPVLGASAGSAYKLLRLLSRRENQTRESFLSHWRNEHSRLVQGTPEFWRHVRGYTQHVIIPEATLGMKSGEENTSATRFDGVDEYYFDSLAELKTAFTEPLYRSVVANSEKTFTGDGCITFVARQEFIYDIS
jgi:EthD domain